jgi:hypothetical protein
MAMVQRAWDDEDGGYINTLAGALLTNVGAGAVNRRIHETLHVEDMICSHHSGHHGLILPASFARETVKYM